MTAAAEHVLEQFRALPPEDRELVAANIWHEVEASDDFQLSDAWMREIERRSKEIDDGTAVLIPHEEAMRRIRQKHGF